MDIRRLAEQYNDYIIEQRRWFHQHPEISGQEEKTTEKIDQELKKMGMSVKRFNGMYGCYADLVGGHPGSVVMLRADIDALAVKEESGLSFASKNTGVMHACGHDAHIAIQLGAAKILTELRAEIHGTVRFFFQAEEELGVGAKKSIVQGVTQGVDACYGIHVWGGVPSCCMNMEMGERMTSSDHVTITVQGESAHASAPHLGKDAIVAAASIIMNLQTVISRFCDPLAPAVLTVATINGGSRFNTLPEKVVMVCSVRAFNREIRDRLEVQIKKVVKTTAEAMGCSAEIIYDRLADPIINEYEKLVETCRNAAEKLYGKDFLIHLNRISASEDYSHLMYAVPSIFGFLGAANISVPGSELSNHHEKFTIDEDTLHYGSGVAAQFAIDYLKNNA